MRAYILCSSSSLFVPLAMSVQDNEDIFVGHVQGIKHRKPFHHHFSEVKNQIYSCGVLLSAGRHDTVHRA